MNTPNQPRQETAKSPLLSLIDIQSAYFDILDHFFGQPFSQMKSAGATPYSLAEHLVSNTNLVRAFSAEGAEFFEVVREFWQKYSGPVNTQVRQLPGLKSFFGGDIFPSYASNIASGVGLYMDTILLPDPMLKLGDFWGRMDSRELLRLTAKHALNALQYREIALAEVHPPIVLIVPNHSLAEETYTQTLRVASEGDALQHASLLFDRQFVDMEDLSGFLSQMPTVDDVVRKVIRPDRLLFDTEWSASTEENIRRYVDETKSSLSTSIKSLPAGSIVGMAIAGRMMQAADALLGSSDNDSSPLIDAPTSWQYLLWKYEYDGADTSTSDTLAANAIAVNGSSEIGLLSNVPIQALVDLRREGALKELRSLLSKGIQEINEAPESSLTEVSKMVSSNLNRAFEDHERQLRDLSSSRRKFFGQDVSTWLATGAISIAAAKTGNITLAVLTSLLGTTIGAPSLKDVREKWKEMKGKARTLRHSPAGILFRHLKRK